MKEIRVKNRKMRNLAKKIISQNECFSFIEDNNIRICFLSSNKEKKANGGLVHGDCELIQDKYKWAIKYDFVITFYEPNNTGFNPEQLEILMYHELLHIGQDDNGELKINPHDIEDFREILQKHGLFWNETK